MSWYFLAAINVIAISVGSLFQKLSMKDDASDPIASSIVFQFLLGAITLVYALIHGLRFPTATLLPFFLISGILYAVGTVSFFYAYKSIGASEATILGGAGVIFTIVASFVFLKDTLSPVQFFGVVLILSAVVIINMTKEKFKLNKGAWLAILGTGAYGLAVVCDSFIVKHYDAVSYLSLICFLPGTIIYLMYAKRTPAIIRAIRHIDKNLIIFTFLYSIQAITFYVALSVGALVSEISSISRAAIILTVILATIFLKETKHIPRKILAAVLTTIGVLLVTR